MSDGPSVRSARAACRKPPGTRASPSTGGEAPAAHLEHRAERVELAVRGLRDEHHQADQRRTAHLPRGHDPGPGEPVPQPADGAGVAGRRLGDHDDVPAVDRHLQHPAASNANPGSSPTPESRPSQIDVRRCSSARTA